VIDKLTADVGYSAFSEVLRETPERVSQVYRKLSLSVDAACIAGFALCLVVGPWLIHTLYKPSYATAATFMPILAMSILPRRFDTITSLILSSGKSSTIMYISAMRAITICVGLIAGYHFLGMTGALLAVGLSQLAGVPLAIKTASPILGGRIWRDVAWIVATVGIAVIFALFGQVTVAGS
jgi:O-antigen/teichoic acid export membrane protein